MMLFDERNCPEPLWQSGMAPGGGTSTTNMCCPQPVCPPAPVMEPPMERCVQRNICHDVKHICPINTRVINNHIYRHTYVPHYTCSEQNVVNNVSCGSCCDFL